METKQMTIADINMVFGKEEEPMIKYVYDIVLAALNSRYVREASIQTSLFFDKCKIEKIGEEQVLCGLLIKDTVVEIKTRFEEGELRKKDVKIGSSPYSAFMIFLKNHKMVLVKNQSESPDIRNFSATLRDSLKEFINKENAERKKRKESYLPRPIINVTGIKTTQSVKEALKNVEKIDELTLHFYPLNSEWELSPVMGALSEKARKKIGSKKGRVVFPSPTSKEGVAELIEEISGVAQATMKVTYNSDISYSGSKSKGRIKDDQISETANIDLKNSLEDAFEEIYESTKNIKPLHVMTESQKEDYNKYIQ